MIAERFGRLPKTWSVAADPRSKPPTGRGIRSALFLSLLIGLALVGCGEKVSQEPTRSDADPPAQQAVASESANQSASDARLERQHFHPKLERPPIPLPFPARGLSFQRSKIEGFFQPYKPIGDAKFDRNGNLYMSFPTRNAVILFSAPKYDLSFFGAVAFGGHDEPIVAPNTIDILGEDLYFTNTTAGQVSVFNSVFELQHVYQIKIKDPIPGPGPSFLITSPKNPGIFFRANEKNEITHHFAQPFDPTKPPESQLLVFQILADWQLAAARVGGDRILHYDPAANLVRQYFLDLAPFFGPDFRDRVVVHDLVWEQSVYWLLLSWQRDEGERAGFMVLVAETGDLIDFYSLPFAADGFDLTPGKMVLFQREEAGAQIFQRD